MINLLLSLSLMCSSPELLNQSKEGWTKDDIEFISTIQQTCLNKYNKCLKKLIKREPLVFWAICGE